MGSNASFQSAFKDSKTGKSAIRICVLSGFGAGVLEALVIVIPFEDSWSYAPAVEAPSPVAASPLAPAMETSGGALADAPAVEAEHSASDEGAWRQR
ncbi:hypothetical protein K1719_037667 [Acacia pycnantha]|nr:hypothetical protein K1719_037667 [Acacia pycnantha]